jgi:hypothetical protein
LRSLGRRSYAHTLAHTGDLTLAAACVNSDSRLTWITLGDHSRPRRCPLPEASAGSKSATRLPAPAGQEAGLFLPGIRPPVWG